MVNEKKDEETTTPTANQFEKLAIAGEKSALYMRTIEDFTHWVTVNMMSNLDVEECTSILQDYIKSNEHIIQRINKVMPLS
jgi:hypothetical protein